MEQKAKIRIELPGGFVKEIEGDAVTVLVHTEKSIEGCSWANAELGALLNMVSAIDKAKKDLLKSNPILALFGESIIEKMSKEKGSDNFNFDDFIKSLKKRRGGGGDD